MNLATTSLDIFRLLFWDRAIFQETMEEAWVRHSVIGGGRTCLKTWSLASMTGPQGYVPIAVVIIASIILQSSTEAAGCDPVAAAFTYIIQWIYNDLPRIWSDLEWFYLTWDVYVYLEISWVIEFLTFIRHPIPFFPSHWAVWLSGAPTNANKTKMLRITCSREILITDHLQPQSFLARICRKTHGEKWDNHGTISWKNHGASAIVEVSYWMWWIPGWIGATWSSRHINPHDDSPNCHYVDAGIDSLAQWKKLPLAIRNISICILLYIIKYILIYNNI